MPSLNLSAAKVALPVPGCDVARPMSSGSRVAAFLGASFLSSLGDTLLVFAVPAGLGLETGDIRAAVCMWLIPAVAMFLSSFLHRRIRGRPGSVRRDYALLLLAIASLEAIIALLAMRFGAPRETLILVTAFVFLYAAAKEGIPRLLYLVAIYRYFTDAKGYSRIAGLNNALGIAASFLGTVLAAALVIRGHWRLALIIDAATFVVFGCVILFLGRDPDELAEGQKPAVAVDSSDSSAYATILAVVPLLFGMNALVWNYLPLLSEQFNLVMAGKSILLISVLRLPGLVAGLFLSRIMIRTPAESLIRWIPLAYFLATFFFAIHPSEVALSGLIIAHGFLTGVYWPSDYTIRNRLGHESLVAFNTQVLRRLAGFQFVACCAAIWIFSPTDLRLSWIPVSLLIAASVSIILALRGRIRAVGVASATVAVTMVLGGCSPSSPKRVWVRLPSVSKDLRLRPELTYSAMTILNDTSAHLLRVSPDLTLKSEVLKSYEKLEGGRRYLLELDPGYRSARGEPVTAEDLEFTIRVFLALHRDVQGPLIQIEGAGACKSIDCPMPGLRADGPNRLNVRLASPDLRFVERLASPWLILFKKGKPLVEEIGACKIPYQTGVARVTACDETGVTLETGGRQIVISDRPAPAGERESRDLVTTNPGTAVSPTLTIMSLFANPESRRLSHSVRFAILTAIRSKADELASRVRLRSSSLLTPQWLAVEPPADLVSIHAPSGKLTCPAKPIRLLLDTSLPDLAALKSFFREAIPCEIDFQVTQADRYFRDFATSDLGVCWFTPDSLDLYNAFTSFDCSPGANCYFNWRDRRLQAAIDKVRKASEGGVPDKDAALQVERILFREGYAAPLAEMNWWIVSNGGGGRSGDRNGPKPIHPAGLFQVSARDFL